MINRSLVIDILDSVAYHSYRGKKKKKRKDTDEWPFNQHNSLGDEATLGSSMFINKNHTIVRAKIFTVGDRGLALSIIFMAVFFADINKI